MKHDLYKLAEQYHLSSSEQALLQAVVEAADQNAQYSVREFAARNYTSPAAIIRLSKKLGYTGYTDMVYRLQFLLQNEISNRTHASHITSFIGEIPPEQIHSFLALLAKNRQGPILITGTGFCAPLRDFLVRKLLVLGYHAIGTNSYEVYENNALQAKLVIAISKSGTTDTIVKPVQDARRLGMDVIAFTGGQHSPIAQQADPAFILLDDKILDDRNLTANYFYARVLILFEYLMDLSLDPRDTPGEAFPAANLP